MLKDNSEVINIPKMGKSFACVDIDIEHKMFRGVNILSTK